MKIIKLKIAYIITCIVVSAVLVEGISALILKKINRNSASTLKFNRELSGYTIFKSTPDFIYQTFKDSASQKDLQTDHYGLICDEPLTFAKDPNTVRIFLMGGSAMIGAGQYGAYSYIKKFPGSTYAWDISIAGYLKKFLEQKFRGKKIQVVNAACYGRQFHQSLIYYLETVSRFKPDIVINMDGYNDVVSLSTGNVFDLAEFIKLKAYVDMKVLAERPVNGLKSVQLISYLFNKKSDLTGNRKWNYYADTAEYNRAKYGQMKKQLQNSSTAFLKVMNQYMNVLKGDSVHFLFALQPMLAREINKPLSGSEQRMKNEIGQPDPAEHMAFYPDPRFDLKNNPMNPDSLNGLGRLVRCYFFDDWLSERLRQDIESKGFLYLDMNREISGLDKNFEFYTDYCHMTKEGNKFVAEKIGATIVEKNFIQ